MVPGLLRGEAAWRTRPGNGQRGFGTNCPWGELGLQSRTLPFREPLLEFPTGRADWPRLPCGIGAVWEQVAGGGFTQANGENRVSGPSGAQVRRTLKSDNTESRVRELPLCST